MLLLAMPCRAAGGPEQVEGLDELWQAAESYGVEPDGDLSGGLSGLAEQALGQAGGAAAPQRPDRAEAAGGGGVLRSGGGGVRRKAGGGLQAVQMAGALAVTALSVSDMQTMIGLGRQTIEQMDGFGGGGGGGGGGRRPPPAGGAAAAAAGGAPVLFPPPLPRPRHPPPVRPLRLRCAGAPPPPGGGERGVEKAGVGAEMGGHIPAHRRPAGLCGLSHRQRGHRRLGRRRRDQDSQNGHLSGRPGGRRHPGRRGGDRAGGGPACCGGRWGSWGCWGSWPSV